MPDSTEEPRSREAGGVPATGRWLLYGAYGFTGELIAREAVLRGRRPVLAGRDASRLHPLAEELGLESRVFDLDDGDALRRALGPADALVLAAGPFIHTSRSAVDACLETGTHYVDITGEVAVFRSLEALGPAARAAGLVLLPGMGFDVVPTDCAAALAAGQVERPTHLEIAIHSTGGPSRGTARTMAEHLGRSALWRRADRIESVPREERVRTIPFADRARPAVAIAWGDIVTAYRSTGVPNIGVWAGAPRAAARVLGALGPVLGAARPLLETTPVRALLRRAVDALVDGPDAEELARGHARVRARAWSEETGAETAVELRTPNGYTLTAVGCVEGTSRLLGGRLEAGAAGFQTPSTAFGAGFAESLPGVERVRNGAGLRRSGDPGTGSS